MPMERRLLYYRDEDTGERICREIRRRDRVGGQKATNPKKWVVYPEEDFPEGSFSKLTEEQRKSLLAVRDKGFARFARDCTSTKDGHGGDEAAAAVAVLEEHFDGTPEEFGALMDRVRVALMQNGPNTSHYTFMGNVWNDVLYPGFPFKGFEVPLKGAAWTPGARGRYAKRMAEAGPSTSAPPQPETPDEGADAASQGEGLDTLPQAAPQAISPPSPDHMGLGSASPGEGLGTLLQAAPPATSPPSPDHMGLGSASPGEGEEGGEEGEGAATSASEEPSPRGTPPVTAPPAGADRRPGEGACGVKRLADKSSDEELRSAKRARGPAEQTEAALVAAEGRAEQDEAALLAVEGRAEQAEAALEQAKAALVAAEAQAKLAKAALDAERRRAKRAKAALEQAEAALDAERRRAAEAEVQCFVDRLFASLSPMSLALLQCFLARLLHRHQAPRTRGLSAARAVVEALDYAYCLGIDGNSSSRPRGWAFEAFLVLLIIMGCDAFIPKNARCLHVYHMHDNSFPQHFRAEARKVLRINENMPDSKAFARANGPVDVFCVFEVMVEGAWVLGFGDLQCKALSAAQSIATKIKHGSHSAYLRDVELKTVNGRSNTIVVPPDSKRSVKVFLSNQNHGFVDAAAAYGQRLDANGVVKLVAQDEEGAVVKFLVERIDTLQAIAESLLKRLELVYPNCWTETWSGVTENDAAGLKSIGKKLPGGDLCKRVQAWVSGGGGAGAGQGTMLAFFHPLGYSND